MFVNIKFLFLYLILTISSCSCCHKSKKLYQKDISSETSVLDTGIGSLGLFLSNSVKHLPVPRRNYHYRIHHHYHNRDKVLKEIHVLPRDITICEGNPGSFCPNGTWALCTKNGAIRCISSLWDTLGCDEGPYQHCAQAQLPCFPYLPECRNGTKKYFEIDIPCISMLKMYVNLVYVNGTVIAQDLIKIYPPDIFCVTVLALPAKLTEGEELFNDINDIFGEFAVKLI
ncbi:uncharacterized protein LOC130901675 [Diorhabda carinulata]|uniref:uncharacterized protein LOC130901675 n=1 Tax=Diorhabda carinulata TaxID=1163345 RepID=UPI0025A1C5EB|nr:uncharacterized protein LOC130901675 [Diorhabda carinulata]